MKIPGSVFWPFLECWGKVLELFFQFQIRTWLFYTYFLVIIHSNKPWTIVWQCSSGGNMVCKSKNFLLYNLTTNLRVLKTWYFCPKITNYWGCSDSSKVMKIHWPNQHWGCSASPSIPRLSAPDCNQRKWSKLCLILSLLQHWQRSSKSPPPTHTRY